MADELAVVVEPTQEEQQNAYNAELKQQMEFRLTGELPAQEQSGEQGASEQQQVATTTTTQDEIVDANEYLKSTLGYDSWETAKTEIEALRQYKANPTQAEIKYENEQSEKLAKAFQAGKVDEVYEYIDQQRRLDKFLTSEVNDDTAGDIIKLGLKIKHPDLLDSEIDYKFNKQYAFPKEPVKKDEFDEDFDAKHAEWKEAVEDIKMSRRVDAKTTKPYLEQAKTKLVLPTIETAVDQDYLQYKKSIEDEQKSAEESNAVYKTFTTKSIETKFDFNDEANKIAFQFQYEPDQESFNKAIEFVSNPSANNPFSNQDGTPNRQKVLDAIYFGLNKEKVIMEAIKQGKNAAIKSMLPDNSNGGLGNRQLPQNLEPNELHKQMVQAGVVR